MKRWVGILAVVISLSGSLAALDVPRLLTLDDALAIAKEKNVDLAMARYNLEEFRSQYWQALSAGLPHITFDGSAFRYSQKPVAFMGGGTIETSRENVLQAGVTVEQSLYEGGKVLHSVKAATHARQAGEESLAATEQSVVQAVKNLFYAALLSSSTAQIQSDNLKSTLSHLDTIRARYRQGIDSDLTLQRQEVEVADARASALRSQNLHEMALIGLQETLTLNVDRPIEVSGDLAPPHQHVLVYDDLIGQALARHPGLQAVRDTTAFYEHKIKLVRGDFFPKLSLVGKWGWHAESEDSTFISAERASSLGAGLALKIPLFTGGRTLQVWRQSVIDYARAREREQEFERAVRVDVRRQWLNVKDALERARSQEAAIEQARLALHATEIRYKAGQSSLLDLNDATLALNQIRTRTAQASHDYWVSLAALEKAVGGPVTGATP